MFGLTTEHLKKRCASLEVRVASLLEKRDRLEDINHTLTVENKKLKTKREIEEEKIAHKIKMREEQVDINYQRKEHEILSATDKRVAKVKDDYRDKVEKQLEKRGNELKEMYIEILNRLPDVNLAIKQKN